jgi:hypothetical protein
MKRRQNYLPPFFHVPVSKKTALNLLQSKAAEGSRSETLKFPAANCRESLFLRRELNRIRPLTPQSRPRGTGNAPTPEFTKFRDEPLYLPLELPPDKHCVVPVGVCIVVPRDKILDEQIPVNGF